MSKLNPVDWINGSIATVSLYASKPTVVQSCQILRIALIAIARRSLLILKVRIQVSPVATCIASAVLYACGNQRLLSQANLIHLNIML